MGLYILRRLGQSVFTVIGVMLLTFVLFRVIAGDISATYVSPKAGYEKREDFLRKHKLDLPLLYNTGKRLRITDNTKGDNTLDVKDAEGSQAAEALALMLVPGSKTKGQAVLEGRLVGGLTREASLAELTDKMPLVEPPRKHPTAPPVPLEEDIAEGEPLPAAATSRPTKPQPALLFLPADGKSIEVDLADVKTCGELIDRINSAPGNRGRLEASLTRWTIGSFFNSQFFWHMADCITFRARSFDNKQTLLEIISERAKFSLSLTVPGLALGWLLAMVISSVVAYYRGRWIDHVGVFLSVLGMCIPFLAYMILGQWIMFHIYPPAAWGLSSPFNVYVPVMIAVIGGIGGSVRFYRTVILNEVHQDYVRTARAKGVSLPSLLFKHILKNCMLPILTNIVLSLPFLILGSLLLEQFFGIPGLGDLMVSSISNRDVPIITAMTFLTAVIYVIGLLITDILYAVFDPRIRLR
jgi:peptide/nickel transport system permease protein